MKKPVHLPWFMNNFALIALSVFILLNCDFQKRCYFRRRMQKVLRHTDGIIHVCHENLWSFDTFEL